MYFCGAAPRHQFYTAGCGRQLMKKIKGSCTTMQFYTARSVLLPIYELDNGGCTTSLVLQQELYLRKIKGRGGGAAPQHQFPASVSGVFLPVYEDCAHVLRVFCCRCLNYHHTAGQSTGFDHANIIPSSTKSPPPPPPPSKTNKKIKKLKKNYFASHLVSRSTVV